MNCGILPEALQEAIDVAAWYESNQHGPGNESHNEFQHAIQRIQSNPQAHSRLEEYTGDEEVRRCMLKRFPYLVIFEVTAGEVFIVAVAHARREPFFWKGRNPH